MKKNLSLIFAACIVGAFIFLAARVVFKQAVNTSLILSFSAALGGLTAEYLKPYFTKRSRPKEQE
jgi:hypothetical protein